MKQLITILLALTVLLAPAMGQTRENGMDGLILGAGGGALIGQAIGRNTEATLIGTAVGSMLGYIVGNEMDKNGTLSTSTVRYVPRATYPRPRYVETAPLPRHQDPVCRETEILATIDGRPEKIYGTACLQDGEWVIESPQVVSQTIILKDDNGRHSRRHNSHYKRAQYRRPYPFNYRHSYRSAW